MLKKNIKISLLILLAGLVIFSSTPLNTSILLKMGLVLFALFFLITVLWDNDNTSQKSLMQKKQNKKYFFWPKLFLTLYTLAQVFIFIILIFNIDSSCWECGIFEGIIAFFLAVMSFLFLNAFIISIIIKTKKTKNITINKKIYVFRIICVNLFLFLFFIFLYVFYEPLFITVFGLMFLNTYTFIVIFCIGFYFMFRLKKNIKMIEQNNTVIIK